MSIDEVGNAPYYGAVAFGAGYLTAFFGLLVGFCEVAVENLRGVTITADIGLMYVFVFLYAICGIWLGISIIRSSRSVRASGNSELGELNSPITVLSLTLFFLGLANIMYLRSEATSYPFDSTILLVVSAVLLLVGFRIYREKTNASRLMGALLMLVSTVLLYFFGYTSLYQTSVLNYFGFTYSSSSGPLFCQLAVERLSLPLAAFCSMLYVVPAVQKGSRLFAVRVMAALSVVAFSVGLMYFNFPAASGLFRTNSLSSGSMFSPWIIAFGLLSLAISGIIVLISALLSIFFLYRTRSSSTPPVSAKKPQSGSPQAKVQTGHAPTNRCPRCGFENMTTSSFCGKCGLPLKDETIPY